MVTRSNNKTSYFLTATVFLLLNILGLTFIDQAYQAKQQEQREDLDFIAQKQALITQHELEEYLSANFTLATIVNEKEGELGTLILTAHHNKLHKIVSQEVSAFQRRFRRSKDSHIAYLMSFQD